MAYYHGITTSELPTKIVPAVDVESGLIFAVGTAPVHLATDPAAANVPVMCYELSEYVEKFGYTGDFANYTLDEVANSNFQLFKVSPSIFVNVLDPAKHFKAVEKTIGGLSNPVTIAAAMFLDSLKVTSSGEEQEIDLVEETDFRVEVRVTEPDEGEGEEYLHIELIVGAELPSDEIKLIYKLGNGIVEVTKSQEDFPFDLPVGGNSVQLKAITTPKNTLVAGEDFTAAYNSDGEVVFTLLDDAKVFNDTVQLSYRESAPELVTSADIIGGYDAVSGKYKGLECVEQVFPKFREPVGIIIAPKFSQDVTVAAIMKAKCVDINSVFQAVAIVDIPSDEVPTYTAAAEYKNLKNLIDKNLIVCYPRVSLGGVSYNLSTQLASLMNYVDAQKGYGTPYFSPSNQNLQADSSVLADGEELLLTLDQANYLNSQGICTALNFIGGWKFWNNSTSAFPGTTDPKDRFIPVRRMFCWLRNTLVLTFWSEIDSPMNKRLIEKVVDSVNIWLNGLANRGIVLPGSRISFREKDNPTTDLLAGKITFHIDVTPPVPAEKISFELEYDTTLLNSLFE